MDTWIGIAKLIEETGELQQVLGKILAYPENTHPQGDMRHRLIEELADVRASINFFVQENLLPSEVYTMEERLNTKFNRFEMWKKNNQIK